MAEQDQVRPELGQPAGRLPVARRVGGEHVVGLPEAGTQGWEAEVEEHVTADQRAVGLAPVGDVAGRVAGDVQDGEACYFVSFAEAALHGVRLGRGEPVEQLGCAALRGWRTLALGSACVSFSTPKRDVEGLADRVARAVVVRVGVGERVCGDGAAGQLAEDALAVAGGAGVDEDVAGQVHIDRVARPAAELEDVVGDPVDGAAAYAPTRSRAPSTPETAAQWAQQYIDPFASIP
jgi:hypothetical protein